MTDPLDYRPLVSDEQVEAALDTLRNARGIAAARAELVRAEHMLKHTLALVAVQSNAKSEAAKQRDAYSSRQYLDAVERVRAAAHDMEMAKAQREAAVMTIEAWRTMRATERAMRL
jgi:hypothetical protein